jgi:hypothetical protein
MYIYIQIYIFIFIYMYMYMYIFVYIYIYIYVYIYIQIYRKSTKPPSILQRVIIHVRPKAVISADTQLHGCYPDNDKNTIEKIDSLLIIKSFSVLLYGCIISNDDIYTTMVKNGIGNDVCIVGRIAEVLPLTLGTSEEGMNIYLNKLTLQRIFRLTNIYVYVCLD